MKLNFTEGSYTLSFFNVVLETNEDISHDVIEENQSTFVHEFIHYLQDLILPYNIRLNLSNVRFFFNICQSAYSHHCITRPFNDWNNESDILHTQLMRSIGGDNVDEDRFVDKVNKLGTISSDYVMINGFDSNLSIDRTHRVYKYYLPVYKFGSSSPIQYNIGARDFLEYIAYKIELKHYPNRPAAPDLPYKSIDFIFDKYGLSHISDDIRLCIAERCLYNDTPTHFLLNILLGDEKIKEYLNSHSYQEIYNYLLYSHTTTRDGYSESISSKTDRRLKQFADELKQQYICFNEIKVWILAVNEFSTNKLSKRFIFSDMYKMAQNELLVFINTVISEIGLPLVMNTNEKYVSLQSQQLASSQFIQFYVLQKFIDFVISPSKEKSCPIYNFCKANVGLCDERCISDLQLKIKNNTQCPYVEFLGLHRLSNITIS